MDNLFHIISDAQVVLRSKGTFYQKKLYRRGEPPVCSMGQRVHSHWLAGRNR